MAEAAGIGKHVPASYRNGVIMLLLSGVCLSSGGILVRNIEAADGWQVLFFRSLAFAVTVFCVLIWRYRGNVFLPFREIGAAGWVAAGALAAGFTCYLFGLILTTVANVSFIISAGPFFAALLAWLILRERVSAITWLAMTLALAGIGVMFADGLASGDWFGNLVALGAPLTFAVMVVAMRSAKGRDMLPATCLAGIIAALVAYGMAADLSVSPRDLVLSLILGSVQIGGGFILITLGTRSVPAAQVPLLALTETVLAPLWVWLFINEVPTWLALIGGAIVLSAVLGQGIAGLREESKVP